MAQSEREKLRNFSGEKGKKRERHITKLKNK
jgi:hypothetical protein